MLFQLNGSSFLSTPHSRFLRGEETILPDRPFKYFLRFSSDFFGPDLKPLCLPMLSIISSAGPPPSPAGSGFLEDLTPFPFSSPSLAHVQDLVLAHKFLF